jgi:peptidoglycan/xylan/chitin deacetylase (PgdA/CDA1 family)
LNRVVESLLNLSGAPRRAARRSGRNRVVLAFHNVVPDGEAGHGDRSLHMPASHFHDLLRTLRQHAALVPLDDLVTSRSAAPQFAVTFDDAYLGAMTTGLAALRDCDASATVFVAPGLLGQRSTWWDDAASPSQGAIPDATRDAWLDGDAAGLSQRIRPQLRVPAAGLPASYAIADDALVRTAAGTTTVTLASHSWSHASLSALATHGAQDTLAHELSAPLTWLRDSGAPMLPMLAYPYGRWNGAAAAAARAAGYTAAFRVDGGALARNDDAFALPRINVPSAMRAAGVWLRAAGWR